jgi:hypothetical protein
MSKEGCDQCAKCNGTQVHTDPDPEAVHLKVCADQEFQDDMHPKEEAPVIEHRTRHTPSNRWLAS